MKTKTLEIFKFSELDEDSKRIAIDAHKYQTDEILWQEELSQSLLELFKQTDGIILENWSLGINNSNLKFSFDNEEVKNFTNARAMAWLENNLLSKIRVPFTGLKRTSVRQYGKFYYPGKLKPCPFTGYCSDDDFLNDLIQNIKKGYCLQDCFQWLGDLYSKLLQQEYDSQNSDEYIADFLEANEYEFISDGRVYNY